MGKEYNGWLILAKTTLIMSRLLLLIFSLLLFSTTMSAQKNPAAYALYNQKGKKVKYKKMLKALSEADVILFGESHNDAIAHWMQNLVARDLQSNVPISVGMEMLESDQQDGINGYLQGSTTLEELDKIGEGMWPNFTTDYQPLVDFARGEGIPVIATNVPRRFARVVFKEGFAGLDNLSAEDKALLPALPVPYDAELPGYKKMLEMMPGGHGGATFPMAQAIKDATMAHFIVANKQDGRPFLHLNGSYHSDNFEGIGWYLNEYAPGLNVVTITTVEEADISELSAENTGKAHFTLAVPALMTKTY